MDDLSEARDLITTVKRKADVVSRGEIRGRKRSSFVGRGWERGPCMNSARR